MQSFQLVLAVVFFVSGTCVLGFKLSAGRFSANMASRSICSTRNMMCEAGVGEDLEFAEEDVKSREIDRVLKIIDEMKLEIQTVRDNKVADDEQVKINDEEFGDEIARVKKEFARIKERSYEEAKQASNEANAKALTEVLPITDNYNRARPLFVPAQNENEEKILGSYENIFEEFNSVLEKFGVEKVVCLGQPFDFNFMEAIMTSPSPDYPKDTVCTEYASGYKMGEKCIRPAMVVVSTGP